MISTVNWYTSFLSSSKNRKKNKLKKSWFNKLIGLRPKHSVGNFLIGFPVVRRELWPKPFNWINLRNGYSQYKKLDDWDSQEWRHGYRYR